MNQTTDSLPTKNHYEVLDGLRGVAALLVVVFHMFEPYDGGDRFKQIMNHGYLAVDFFFLLSGFVVAYAYDDRWGRMTQWEFYKRRLIRLQPMVIAGSVIGAALFYVQKGPAFPLIAMTPVWKTLLLMVVGFTLIPVLTSMDIRGWQEMHPLDGPAWSLFFEYIANILYGVGVRKFSKKALSVLVLLSAGLLVQYLVMGPRGDVIGGWALTAREMHVGFARMLYPFFAGVLLMRLGWRVRVKRRFALCSLILIAVFWVPRIGDRQHLWLNGIYESVCILLVFPIVVAMGAGNSLSDGFSTRVCRFLGKISYPLYITHYPLIYLYTEWVVEGKLPVMRGVVVGAGLLVVAVAIAYGCLTLYDEPVRDWMGRRFLGRRRASAMMQG